MNNNVLLIAVQQNWGLQCPEDWHETLYILRENGELTTVIHEGKKLTEKRNTLSAEDLSFIREHVDEYIRMAWRVDACDGTAWEVRSGAQEFELGYVYGTDLEKITDILDKVE